MSNPITDAKIDLFRSAGLLAAAAMSVGDNRHNIDLTTTEAQAFERIGETIKAAGVELTLILVRRSAADEFGDVEDGLALAVSPMVLEGVTGMAATILTDAHQSLRATHTLIEEAISDGASLEDLLGGAINLIGVDGDDES